MYGDELNTPEAGKDYGWPSVSNGEHYNKVEIPHHETTQRYERPAYYWRPAISPSGLEFYTGTLFSDWENDLFIGSLSSKALIRVKFDDKNIVKGDERIELNQRIRDVMTANDGSIYRNQSNSSISII